MLFQREDWKLFRSIETLTQKAGVSQQFLPLLVVKELVDNGLDAGGNCSVGFEDPQTFFVKDDGDGIDPLHLANLFSINRPMISSKLLRLPTRGALGNGLRVVMGAVVATNGIILIGTKSKMYKLIPQNDGSTKCVEEGEYREGGFKVIIKLGLPINRETLAWGKNAILMNKGEFYKGKTSPFWYTSEGFYELVNAANTDLATLLTHLHGINKKFLQQVLNTFGNLKTNEMDFEQTEDLLHFLRHHTKPVSGKKLGFVGEGIRGHYHKKISTFTMRSAKGRFHAEIPVVVETWATITGEKKANLNIFVNKTQIVSDIHCWTEGKKITYYGNGFLLDIRSKPTDLNVNVITPYMPITSDGKSPDFSFMRDAINEAIKTATKKANKFELHLNHDAERSEKEIILKHLDEAVEKTSGFYTYKFSQRQLYYATRPFVLNSLGKELGYNYFCHVITQYEAENGPIQGLYRDPRGILYHPHLGQEIPLGTLAVDGYERPAWTFNKILYSEKEGFFQILKDVKFPERFDCALLTSKGYASRAVKDLFDLLGDTNEEILFFCIHDADSAGTKIYETLQEATLARAARRVKIINLGLDPWEAVEMGLEVENFESKGRRPVANYVKEYTQDNYFWDNIDWEDWLQNKRIELNAMTSPQFIDWLEIKIKEYGNGKLIPSTEVMESVLNTEVEELLKKQLAAEILKEAGYEEKVKQALQAVSNNIRSKASNLQAHVQQQLTHTQEYHWSAPVKEIARDLIIKHS